MILSMVQQYCPDHIFYDLVGEEGGELLQRSKYLPPRDDASRFRFEAQAPSASTNKEMLKQAILVLYRLAAEHAKFLLEYGQMSLAQTNPAGYGRLLEESMVFTHELFRQGLSQHDVPGLVGRMPQIQAPTPDDQIINDLQMQLQQAQEQLMMMQQQMAQATGQPMGGPQGVA
jgi:hypothetical protein